MKKGWETSTLGDTCEMYQPKTISGKEMVENGAYPVFGANRIIGRYDKFNHGEPQLLITCRGATCGSVNISEPKSWITGNAMVVRPKNGLIDMRFLEYLFRGGIEISKAITGAAQPQSTRTNLEPLEICFPKSLAEQQRIVGVLEEAFAALANALANAEKNLQNARALFESHLQSVFSQGSQSAAEGRGKGWVEKPFSELCDIKHGYAFEDKFFSNEGASASGVKVRHTSPTKIGEVVIAFPTSIPEQTKIVSTLAALATEIQRLARHYQQMQAALVALKKSLLHQAFTGEL